MKLLTPSPHAIRRRGERGYMLITIILFVALLAIAMTAAAPLITRQVKRDREEEMIHRGVQYSRAIKHYVKKFGRYPTKIEDLENTSNVRFLRRRYKDPITGKDFKLLHMGEVQTSFGSNIAGATSVSNLAAAQASSGGFGSNNSFGNNSAFGGSTFGGNSGSTFGGSAASSFGGSTFGSSGFGNSPQSATNANQANQAQNAGTDAGTADQKVSGQSGGEPTDASTKVFGGGPILGVASISKEKSIRVFNKKDHYNQWQFIYDPTLDTGGLITTPFQPGMQSAGVMQQGVQGQPGTQNSPFGTQGSSFGQGSAFGQGSSFGSPGTMSSPAPSQPQPQGLQSPFPPEQGPQQ